MTVRPGQARTAAGPPRASPRSGRPGGNAGDPPAISAHIVSGLASPQYLVEIDAVAVI